MRRSLAALVSLLTLAALLPFAPSASAASGPVVAEAVFRIREDGKAEPYVRLLSAQAGTTVDFRLRLKGAAEPYATFPKIRATAGVMGGGLSWASGTWTALQQGRTYLDLDIASPSGEHLVVPQAAFADSPSGRFAVNVSVPGTGGGGSTRVTAPFRANISVVHSQDVSKVVARLYRSGTNDQVGEDVVPAEVGTTVSGGYSLTSYTTGAVFSPPVGEYEVAVTATDAAGDSVTNRTAVLDARLPQRLVDLKATPSTLDYEHQEATITGRVVDSGGAPLAGVTVSAGTLNVKTTTAGDGTFTLKAAPGSTALWLTAEAHGDYTYSLERVEFGVRNAPTRVSLALAPGNPKVGDKITLSGVLERQTGAGTWAALPGRQVMLSFTDAETGEARPLATPVTGADGRYSLPVTVPGPGTWKAVYGGTTYLVGAEASAQRGSGYRTQVTNITARPNPVAVGERVTVKGLVTRANSPVDRMFAGNAHVTLFASPDGKRTVKLAEGRADASGHFTLSAAAKADGRWWVAYDGRRPGTGKPSYDLPSTSERFFVDTRYKTAIPSLNASPEPVRKGRTLTVKGRVTKLVGTWRPGAGAVVMIYFRPAGESAWRPMGTAKADRNGWFGRGFEAFADGTWAAAYPGSPAYLGAWSGGDYVDVR
ncbi:carboxypeptidase regulatory-like domain-containing protein [Actinomadura gamaensis]|uniref:Carboxypeptidase regulatory-like domain-containing protein n=1 Tax=Actinomadura gamaensis TaxID=1763541 RepID=A0ABV9TYI5_9ACTN